MIRRRFSLFPGIGPARERAIWAAGVRDWQEFLAAEKIPGLSDGCRQPLAERVREYSDALDRRDASFFARNLPRSDHWMLFEALGDAVRYLDIETTGLSPGYHDVTVVGIHDGQTCRALIRGQGLSAQAIQSALEGCKLLVSYFGSAFDVPFLRVAFPEVTWDFPHFDLCFGGRKVGLTGGLKVVEWTLGLARDRAIADVDGFEAVRLWRAYQRGDSSALSKLVEYNKADTANLATIAPMIYERLCQKAQE